jgi:2'-5' RNA ligase
MRLFFALWPPPAAAALLESWARGCDGNVVPAANIHLTLAFLGEADPAKASAAARRVQARAHRLPIRQARYWKHNQIVWVGPDETPPELVELASQLHAELSEEGFALERRPFAAHVTLLRKASSRPALAPLPALEWPADEFALVRSRSGGGGVRYETLEGFPLSR